MPRKTTDIKIIINNNNIKKLKVVALIRLLSNELVFGSILPCT